MSQETLKGLQQSHYVELTDIQRSAIAPALKGKDILGSAPTGSGKTLAFLIPLIERLYHEKWNREDGLGALIISPTRELALQIFKELRKVGRCHDFSAGLVIGGKDVKTEAERLGSINILIGTPGRLLQHMDQTPNFSLNNLQVLVLDEADRILDSGFKKTLDAILENVPRERQTMLYSATQTSSVSSLARLSLSSPEYIITNPIEKTATPEKLEQFYISTNLADKLTTLYSFLKTHLKSKTIVFFASSKQVRFVYETFRKLQPGIPLIQLHGKQKQQARIDATAKFSKTQHACLFATDVVARGIDFPTVDWVVQVDAPDDVATYIHRVGRTARSNREGKALLFLTPKEEPSMIAHLEARKIPISKLTVKESKRKTIQDKLQALCFKDPEIKYLGQKAFITYVRSIYLQSDKTMFNVDDLPLEEFAKSLGLPGAPKLKINANAIAGGKVKKNIPHKVLQLAKANDDGEIEEQETEPKTKYDRMFERKNQNVLSEHYKKISGGNADANEDEDDFITLKRQDHGLDESDEEEEGSDGEEEPSDDKAKSDDDAGPTSKRALKRALSKKQVALGQSQVATKLKFDDEGNAHPLYELDTLDDFKKQGSAETQIAAFLGKERKEMAGRDVEDKEADRTKRQEKKQRRKEFERQALERELAYEEGSGSDYDGESNSDEEQSAQDDSEDEFGYDGGVERRKRKKDEEEDEGVFGKDDAEYKDFFKAAESDEEEDRASKRQKKSKKRGNKVVELSEAPTSMEDLEALTSQLIGS